MSDAANDSSSARNFWQATARVEALPPLGDAPLSDDFRLLADNLPTCCWLARPDGYIVWYNRRWHEYCGTTPEEMEGWGWQRVHDPNHLPRVLASWRGSIASGEPFEMVFPLRGADGIFRPFLTRIVPLRDSEGAIVRWLGANTEIDAQVRAETALRDAKAERDFIIALSTKQRALTDPDSIMRLSAERLAARLGANRAGFYRIAHNRIRYLEGWTDWSLPPLTGEREMRAYGWSVEQYLREGETLVIRDSLAEDAGDWGIVAKAGVGAAISVALAQEGAQPAGLYVNCRAPRDWTADEISLVQEVAELTWLAVERAEATRMLELRVASQGEQLAEATVAAQAAETKVRQLQKMEAVGQLTGGIAHDFNNMLAVVIGALNLMQRRVARGSMDVGKYLEAAMDGANRAAALTQRLLAFSRQQPLAPEAIDANKMMASLNELLVRTLGENVHLEMVLGAGLWKCHADVNGLENVVINLAVNARDAMPDGGWLTIETTNAHIDDAYAREAEIVTGQYVMLAVTDTGIGMTPDVLARAFEPFFTTKGVGRGTGLGLSQVFGFVRQSGGHIRIYSEVGHGTTLKIYLPRDFGEGTAAAKRKIAGVTGALPGGRSEEIVLVVEDEARVRSLSTEALRDLGYTVLHAADGAAAMQIFESGQHVTLLFTDIVMPDMTGRQLADRAKAMLPDLKVIYTTGYTRNAVVHNGTLDPGVHFLPKPFGIDQLGLIVRQVLDEE
ncbi:Hybrid sensor histidine kinase/response regulator (fragment) [Beijerinckiaceae bacterium RH AL1]